MRASSHDGCLDCWSVSGEVVVIGRPPAPVKLAAFYTCSRDFYYASLDVKARVSALRVSTVARLAPEGGAFTIGFDVSMLHPCRGHYIYLILWADANGNDDYDAGEEWKYVIPLYDDRIFQGATDCVYYYDECANGQKGTERGWNQSVGLERYVPVERATRDGAKLSNDAPWSTLVAQNTVIRPPPRAVGGAAAR